mgnify:CR=1 FL=1
MNEIQKQLNGIYLEYLNKLTSDGELRNKLEIDRISPPVLINIDAPYAQYAEADIKILYIGKENNGWMSRKNQEEYGLNQNFTETEIFLNALLKLYKKFNLGRKYRRAFYTFMDLLLEKFKINNRKPGILWSNLIRLDCVNKKNLSESDKLKEKVFELDENNQILREEIAILKPDIVVFVTGPNYDHFLKKSFPGLKMNQLRDFKPREISILEHDSLPKTSLRIYHPGYHNRLGRDYKSKLTTLIHDFHFDAL